ncbi:unnamed protein product [Caenorhabditis auriculariae]|uniref:Wbp11/ELF5/Saf1 N-terminal domain-containing protein n=1 Tax=Caenorhabditis auriculariae TaxID=2777116 RepID=A0A8S1H7A9_9PELO|nr:unnamed protein product [Caenorhabditis auriculariae]
MLSYADGLSVAINGRMGGESIIFLNLIEYRPEIGIDSRVNDGQGCSTETRVVGTRRVRRSWSCVFGKFQIFAFLLNFHKMPSVSKTKSGKSFRAPTDQARKLERRKENKRNKRDRQQIRHAIAKYCNVEETTAKLLLLERQVLGLDPQPFHVDVLKKKQKVLNDMLNKRRQALQQAKEEDELKRFNEKLQVFHADCRKLQFLAEQAKMAREADPDFIPLPSGEMGHGDLRTAQLMGPTVPQIKKKVDFKLPRAKSGLKPPGVPCGIPPDLSDSEDEYGGGYGHDAYGFQQPDDDDLAPIPIPDFDSGPSGYTNYTPMVPMRKVPPPPPHGMPHMGYNPMGFSSHSHHHIPDNAVISSAPIIRRDAPIESSGPSVPAVLSAAPELRDLRKETVKLVPAALLRKKQTTSSTMKPVPVRRPEAHQQAKSTDDAYNEFMKELDGLI